MRLRLLIATLLTGLAVPAAGWAAGTALVPIGAGLEWPVEVIGGLQDPLGLVWHAGTLCAAAIGRVDACRRCSRPAACTRRRRDLERGAAGRNVAVGAA